MFVKDVLIGEIFEFKFEEGRLWRYQKIGDKKIQCIKNPLSHHTDFRGDGYINCEFCSHLEVVLVVNPL